MQALASAIRQEQWEVAAVLLINAFLKVTDRLPQDAIQGLLEALEWNGYGQEG